MPLSAVGAAVAGLSGLIARYIVPFVVVKMLIAMGIAIGVYVGIDVLADEIVSEVRGAMSGVSADAVGWASAFGVFDAIEIMLAAHVTGVGIKYTAGTIKRWFIK